jgi:hypothetical protein
LVQGKRSRKIEFIHPQINSQQILIAWYKWEFLRRNSEYRTDHEKFIRKYRKWFEERGYWYDYVQRQAKWSEADEDYFYSKIAPVILRLCKKWHVGNLFPPSWNFDKREGLHKIRGWEWGIPTDLPAEMNWDLKYLRELRGWGFSTNTRSASRIGYLVAIEFDLNWPMKDLLGHAKRILAFAQENYHEELEERGVKIFKGRRRLQDYENHLRVWDLKEKGKRPAEISRIIFSNDAFGQGLRKVQDHLKSAEKLIRGHYKEIR